MKNIAIIGASGAIGKAFIKMLSEDPAVKTIYACSRSGTSFHSENITSITLDLTAETSIANAAKKIDQKLDLVIVAAGVLHTDSIKPEKALKELSMQNFQEVFAVNTFGPALIIKHFSPLLKKDDKSVMAILSARVGSISDNRLGGWYTYRASKAALNMLIKTASHELKRINKAAIIMGLHPGTVDSALSKPFQERVPKDKLFTAEYSVSKLLSVIDAADATYNGKCYDYNNIRIDY